MYVCVYVYMDSSPCKSKLAELTIYDSGCI